MTYGAPTHNLDSFHTVDCVRWVTVRSHIQYHTFCWQSGCTTRMKNQKQTLFVLIREPLSPSKSMLPYCTRSMFTTAQTGTVRTNPPGPSGSHLISGATKLSLQPLGLTYNQSEYQKRLIGWMVAKTTNPIQAAQSMEWAVLLLIIIIMKKKKIYTTLWVWLLLFCHTFHYAF